MVGVVLALVMGSVGYVVVERSRQRNAASSAQVTPTAKVISGDLQRTVRVSGMIGARSFAAITAPRMLGRGDQSGGGQMILMKLVKPGSRVKKGELVAEFDRQWQLQRVEDRDAEVVQAEADISKRKAELAILRETSTQNLRAAKADMDKARLDLKTAEVRSEIDAEKMKLAAEETAARYKQLQAEIALTDTSQRAEIRALEYKRDRAKIDKRRAQMNAEKMVMRAPMDGLAVMQTTIRANQPGQVQEGDQVFPGSLFMQVVNPDRMILNGSVNQTQSQEFRLGLKAEIRLDAYPDKTWPGRLFSMGAMATGSSMGFRGGSRALYVKQIPVRFSIEGNDPRIIPDLSASATVLLKEEKNALLIPLEAVQKQDGKPYVWVKRADGGWDRRDVQLGLKNDTHVVAQAGLNLGEEVALDSPHGKVAS